MKCPKCGEIIYNTTEKGEKALEELGFSKEDKQNRSKAK